jgi:hypothetical protein
MERIGKHIGIVTLVTLALLAVIIHPVAATATEVVSDGGFELGPGAGAWTEQSTAGILPLISNVDPHTGSYSAFLGGTYGIGGEPTIDSVDQNVALQCETAELRFWLKNDTGSTGGDFIEVLVGGTQVWSFTEDGGATYGSYGEVVVNLDAFATGNTYNLRFVGHDELDGASNWLVDDVSLMTDGGTDCGDPGEAPEVSTPLLSVPNEGMIMITYSLQQPAYGQPGGAVARDASGTPVVLPKDADGNGFDTYVVTGVQEVDGQTWVSIFLGSGDWGWVPLDEVLVINPIPGVD